MRQEPRSSVKEGVIVEDAREEILSRLQELLMMASRPHVPRDRTFIEWFFNRDPNAAERQAREFAGQQAKALMVARRELLDLLRAESESEQIAFKAQIEARLAVMRAEVERLKLRRDAEALISETEAIEGERNRRRIEDAIKVKELLEGPQKAKQLNQANSEVERVRQRYRAKAETDQVLIDDFRQELINIFLSDANDTEKALRIHYLVDAYKVGRDALPREIRRFLDRVEKEIGDD